jgi:hypothetical protein
VKYAAFYLFFLLFISCASYYKKNQELMDAVYTSNFEAAKKLLADDAKWEKKDKNKLLFYLNKGTVLWMAGEHANSNVYFSKADYFVEDYEKKATDAVLSFLVNPKFSTYGGENFEQILLHYYGALNYLALNQTDEALVEGKRMLEKMQRITDKYKSKNKYRRDAFAHNLIGLIYDLKGENNNAYIAYKNAYEIYKEDYLKQFATPMPEQLKKDLLRTAKATGFYDEQRKFEQEFNMKAETKDTQKGTLLFFWNNGLGPVKDQMSINIMIVPQGNGWVQFVNPELGISVPFMAGDKDQNKDLLDMKYFRLALPKYISRLPYYKSAQLTVNNQAYPFSMVENVNEIAFKSLEDRMLKELSIGLARVALKQLAVFKAQQNNKQQALAAAAIIYSAASEQADTRNWQLLPYSINYTRLQLDTGMQTISFDAVDINNAKSSKKDYQVKIAPGKTKVLSLQTTEFSGYGNK